MNFDLSFKEVMKRDMNVTWSAPSMLKALDHPAIAL